MQLPVTPSSAGDTADTVRNRSESELANTGTRRHAWFLSLSVKRLSQIPVKNLKVPLH